MTKPAWPTTEQEENYWDEIRSEFMIPDNEVYLNTGSWGSLPRAAYDTLCKKLI